MRRTACVLGLLVALLLASVPAAAQGESAITSVLGASGGAATGAGIGLLAWNPFRAYRADILAHPNHPTRHPFAYLWPTFASMGVGLTVGALAGALLPPTATVQIAEIAVMVVALLADGVILSLGRVPLEPPEHFEVGAALPPALASPDPRARADVQLALRF